MQSVNVITEAFERALKRFPKLRQEAIKKATALAEAKVKTAISGRINDSKGEIAGWQTSREGSGGGYGVVKAQKGTVLRSRKSGKTVEVRPGAITNYLESGHKIRSPKTSGAKGYRPRINVAAVSGRWFYRSAEADINRIAVQAADEVCSGIVKEIEG